MYSRSDDPVLAAISAGLELRDTEFKESQPFDVLRYKIAKAAIGMANLRDGGRIIIGAHERDGRLRFDGVTPEHEETYNPDLLIEAINHHADPPVNCTVRVVATDDGTRFVAIEVKSFDRTPVFCKNGTPDGVSGRDKLIKGNIYVRSNERIATTRVVDSELMRELLEIAAERGAAEIVRRAQRVGFSVPNAEREALRARLLDVLDAEQAENALTVIEDFGRQVPHDARGAFRRERRGFEPNE